MSDGNPWPTERSDRLRDMWEKQGLSAAQCAIELGVTRNAVIGRADRMKLTHPCIDGGHHPRCAWPRKETHKRKHALRRTTSPYQFIWETGEPPPENLHELLGPPVSLMALENQHCRWPIDGEDGQMFYCGVTKVECLSYCIQHARMAYQKAPKISDLERVARAIRWRKRQQAIALRRAA